MNEACWAAAGGGALRWLSEHGRIALPVMAALGSGLFAVAQSACLWKLDVQPDELGSTTPSLLGRAVLGLLAALAWLYLFAALMTVVTHWLSWVFDTVAERVEAWRAGSRKRRLMALAVGGFAGAAVGAVVTDAIELTVALVMAALTAAFVLAAMHARPTSRGRRRWAVSWTAGLGVPASPCCWCWATTCWTRNSRPPARWWRRLWSWCSRWGC